LLQFSAKKRSTFLTS